MPLTRLEIEGFRGIRRLDLSFDAITALVGENNTGKTSVLDALSLAFGPAGEMPFFVLDDFHVPPELSAEPAERLRLLFEFREPSPRAWDEAPFGPLGVIARGMKGSGKRQITVELSAQRSVERSAVPGVFRIVRPAGGRLEEARERETLALLKRRYPVLRLRLGQPSETPAPPAAAPSRPMTDAELETTVRRLERVVADAYRRISVTWRPRPSELRDALDPVRELARRYDTTLAAAGGAVGHTLASLAETPVPLGGGNPLRPAAPGPGAGVQNVALLAALGSYLAARGPGPLENGSEPIVLLEDAEAHLHPILLSSVFRVIERMPAQKVVTTNSGDLLASLPLQAVRRLVRSPAGLHAHAVAPGALTVEETRKIAFHVRINRASAVFARCWLLVEGETESWLLPELARLIGYDFPAEGIRCVEFAQCGLPPLIRLARAWGIEWHLLSDGDRAGTAYAAAAREALAGDPERKRITLFREPDVEHFLWVCGYAGVYRAAAERANDAPGYSHRRLTTRAVIERALKSRGKPGMALEVVEAVSRPGSPGVPRLLVRVLETVVGLARSQAD